GRSASPPTRFLMGCRHPPIGLCASRDRRMSLRPSILIIDDEPAIRRFVRASLAGQYEVSEAATAVDGLRRIERERFDVIILDLGLPDVDGLDLIREIRELSD